MKKKQAAARVVAASPSAAVRAIIFLLSAAHATAAGGYEYVSNGSCRDNNGDVYSNIRLTDSTATHDDSACGQSCDVFRSSGTLRGFEWLIVNGSSKRCYCLFDAGSDVEAMALDMGVDGATWKGDNEGTGEIASAENVGIDSYCHKLVPAVRLVDVDGSPSPTPQPQSIEEIFAGIFGDDGGGFTTSQVDDDGQYGGDWNGSPKPTYGDNWNASPSPTLNTTKSSKIFVGWGKTSKSISTKASKSSSMSMECSKSSKASSAMSYGKKGGDWSGSNGSSSKKTSGGGDWSGNGSNGSHGYEKGSVWSGRVWSDDGGSKEKGSLWSSSDGGSYEKKSSQSMKTKTNKVWCSKSGKGQSWSIVEGKASKDGDDSWSMILEQMRYKMGNGGRRSGGVELLLLMLTSISVSLYLRV